METGAVSGAATASPTSASDAASAVRPGIRGALARTWAVPAATVPIPAPAIATAAAVADVNVAAQQFFLNLTNWLHTLPATQVTENNPLVCQAIIQYCKINCTSDTPDKTVIRLYEALKELLALSTEWWIPGDDG